MDIIPGPVTTLGLCLGAAIPLVLIALSRGLVRIDDVKRRYCVAIGLCVFVWIVGFVGIALVERPPAWHDFIAGALILVTAVWAFGMLWTLICWGFTTSLLQALVRFGRPADGDAWFREYAGGTGIEAFVRDRLSLLTAAGLARQCDGVVALVDWRSRLVAGLVRGLRQFYGLKDE